MMRAERFSVRAYGVLCQEDAILLTRSVFRGKEFVNFPGGGVELGEAPIEALKREFLEETGLRVAPSQILYASESCHSSTQMPIQIVSLYWQVDRLEGEINFSGNGDDVREIFWAPIGSLPLAEMFPADKEFAENLLQHLRLRGDGP